MKAAVFRGERCIEIAEMPDPAIGRPDDVIVRVVRSGICGSDKGLYLQPGDKPGVHGHEAAGVVEEVGPAAEAVKPGERVVVYDVIGCGECRYCAAGQFTYCQHRVGSVSGGYGERLVAPARNLLRLPEDVSFDLGCLLSDNFGTPAKACRKVGVGAGLTVAVFGCGPIGLNTVQVAAAYGAMVIAVDPLAYRREAAVRVGAREAIDPGQDDPVQALRDLTGGGADRALECSGSPQAERQALKCVRPAGRVCFVGECGRLEISPSEDLIRGDVEVMGSWYIHTADFATNLALLGSTDADPLRIVTHTVPLADIGHAFRVFCDHEEDCLKAVVALSEAGGSQEPGGRGRAAGADK